MSIIENGFLPDHDPLTILPEHFKSWESIAQELPKLFSSGHIREHIDDCPPFPIDKLKSPNMFERAMLILSYLGHAYVWCDAKHPAQSIPNKLASAWYEVAKHLGRPPVLSYASYALYNWSRLDKKHPIELGNIVLAQNFLGGIDEEWFILIHIDIEAKAIPALANLEAAQKAAVNADETKLSHYLEIINSSLHNMVKTLKRMPQHCDPYIYYNRVRPYIHGWKDNPALPNGLIYEGVKAYKEQGMKFKGETGAQSSIVPALDACLGVAHKDSPLKSHLDEMRIYMPPEHQAFLQSLEQTPGIYSFIKQAGNTSLKAHYNEAINLLHAFRTTHLGFAKAYIEKQAQSSLGNPTQIGTGGTPFMAYLQEHCDETLEHLLN